jgi:hypothetical protein
VKAHEVGKNPVIALFMKDPVGGIFEYKGTQNNRISRVNTAKEF